MSRAKFRHHLTFGFGGCAATSPHVILSRCMVGLLATVLAFVSRDARADEGGVGFWLPGTFGSLAAVPQQPGWTLGLVYYHTSLEAGGEVAAGRLATINGLPRNVNIDLNLSLAARANIVFAFPTYVFATPVLGGNWLSVWEQQSATTKPP